MMGCENYGSISYNVVVINEGICKARCLGLAFYLLPPYGVLDYIF